MIQTIYYILNSIIGRETGRCSGVICSLFLFSCYPYFFWASFYLHYTIYSVISSANCSEMTATVGCFTLCIVYSFTNQIHSLTHSLTTCPQLVNLMCSFAAALCRVRRRLHFGRKAPKDRAGGHEDGEDGDVAWRGLHTHGELEKKMLVAWRNELILHLFC